MSNETPLQGLDVEPFRIRKFEVGDLVFAKVKGYPAWPSKISQIETVIAGGKENTKYNVFFYGTHQSSILRSSALFHYDTYSQTIIQKYGHKPKFQQAIAELERDMKAKLSYLKEIRSKPDSGWFPGFNNACDGLLTDIQRDVFLGFDESESRVGSSLSGETMHHASEVTSNSEGEDSEEEEVGDNHPLYQKETYYEIMYMENIALPDTNEKFLIVSLSFDRERTAEEGKKIEEQHYLESCYVRIEPLPPHLEAELLERQNQYNSMESPPPKRRGRPPKLPYKWHNSYKEAIKRRLRSTQRSIHEKLRRTTRLRDEERLKSLRTHRPSAVIETSNSDIQLEEESEEPTNLLAPVSRKRTLNQVESVQKITSAPSKSKAEFVKEKVSLASLNAKEAPTSIEPIEKKSTSSLKSKILPNQAKAGKMNNSLHSSKPHHQMNRNGTIVGSKRFSNKVLVGREQTSKVPPEKSRPMTVWDRIQAESGVQNMGSTHPSSDGVLLSCPMCRLKFCSSLELSVHVNAKHIGGLNEEHSNNEVRVSSDQAETPVTPFIMKQVPDDLFEDPIKPNPSKKLTSDELFDNLLNSTDSSTALKPSNSSFKSWKENGSSDIFSCRRVLPFP